MLEKFKFILKGKTAVFIDWANVYGWKKSLKKAINRLDVDLFSKKNAPQHISQGRD